VRERFTLVQRASAKLSGIVQTLTLDYFKVTLRARLYLTAKTLNLLKNKTF